MATFDKDISTSQDLTKYQKNIFNLQSGINSSNTHLYYSTKEILESVANGIYASTRQDLQIYKTIADFTLTINSLQKIQKNSTPSITELKLHLGLLRKDYANVNNAIPENIIDNWLKQFLEPYPSEPPSFAL